MQPNAIAANIIDDITETILSKLEKQTKEKYHTIYGTCFNRISNVYVVIYINKIDIDDHKISVIEIGSRQPTKPYFNRNIDISDPKFLNKILLIATAINNMNKRKS